MSDVAYRARLQAELTRWLTIPPVIIAFALLLQYSFKLKVAPFFSYQGLNYHDPDPVLYPIMLGVTVIVALVLPGRIRHTSDFIQWLLFVMGGAPAILLPQYMKTLPVSEATRLGLAVAGCTIMVALLTRARPHVGRLGHVKIEPGHLWSVLVGFAMVMYALMVVTSGISLRWLDLNSVYGTRDDFATATAGSPIIGYGLPVVYNVINPIFMARGVYSLRWRFLLFGALGQYLIYASTGQKAVLLSIPGIILLALMFRRRPRPKGTRLVAGISIGALATLGLDQMLGGYVWTSLFVRRFLIVPGSLVAGYVSIFGSRPKLGFPAITGAHNPYLLGPSHLVGLMLTGDVTTNANVSLFGDGFLNAGYFGIFVEGLVLVVLLWLADAVTRGLPTPVTSLIFFMPTVAIASASIFTVIASHGYAAALLICMALPRTGWGRPSPRDALREPNDRPLARAGRR